MTATRRFAAIRATDSWEAAVEPWESPPGRIGNAPRHPSGSIPHPSARAV